MWSAVEATAAVAALPGADRRSTGSHERGTDEPQRMPVTQWLSDSVPAIDPATFRLHVVVYDRSIDDLDLDDLDGRDAVRAVLDCTGGWYAPRTGAASGSTTCSSGPPARSRAAAASMSSP